MSLGGEFSKKGANSKLAAKTHDRKYTGPVEGHTLVHTSQMRFLSNTTGNMYRACSEPPLDTPQHMHMQASQASEENVQSTQGQCDQTLYDRIERTANRKKKKTKYRTAS